MNSSKEIAQKIEELKKINGMSSKIICIDGCGGAGKSSYANQLSMDLGKCSIIHTDDFASWDEPLSWYNRMLEQVLLPLAQNKVAKFQKYDWDKRCLSDWIEVKPQEYILIEGVGSCRKEFRSSISYGVYIQTDRVVRLKRGIERDGESSRAQWLEWMAAEDRYLSEHDPQQYVDVIVSGETEHA